jgi:deoxyhypusine synthase
MELKHVDQMRVTAKMTVGQLVAEMEKSGVLGAGRVAKAVAITVDMFRDPAYTVFLTVAGPMVPGGLRRVISLLVEKRYVDALILSGANVVHDIIEGIGYRGIKGSFWADDVALRAKGIGRAGDIYFAQAGFEALETTMHRVFTQLAAKGVSRVSISDLLQETGRLVDDEDSVLRTAATHAVPVFSPGILDSMLGIHLWTYNQLHHLDLDPLADFNQLATLVYDAKQVGVISLGGGLPKHHALGANTLREGVDAAVQITLDRPEGGSFSGAPLEEAISWKKAKTGDKLVSVIGDATIVFPILVAAVLDALDGNE